MPVNHVLQSKQVVTNRAIRAETCLNFCSEVLRLKVRRQTEFDIVHIKLPIALHYPLHCMSRGADEKLR